MALVTTPTLIADAQCVSKCIPSGMQLPVLIAIFAKIANMPIDTTSLITQAQCVAKCVPRGMEMAVLIGIAAQLSGGGGQIGVGQLVEYTGINPTADGKLPSIPTEPALAYHRTGVNPTYYWNTVAQAWV